ncbi:MAG: type I methionyl aminopeptidase [Deinococcales bacterium]
MSIDSPADVAALERVGDVARETLRALRSALRAGVSTLELDRVARRVFARHGARSAPALEYGFPGKVLISVNDEAVHGVPGERVIRAGALVKLDVTPERDGYVADAAVTVAMPGAPAEARRLARCAEQALERAIAVVAPGLPVNAVGAAVEREVRRQGFAVLHELGGHGVGRSIHEEPTVLNYFDRRFPQPLTAGLVFTIEPIISAGDSRVVAAPDGWTLRTADGSLEAHFEHTLVVAPGRPRVITA